MASNAFPPTKRHHNLMTERSADSGNFGSNLLKMALVLGLVSGVVEGIGHLALQRLNILENVWYEIVWIAAFFNALALVALAAVFAAIIQRADSRRLRSFAVFSLAIAAVLPCLAL